MITSISVATMGVIAIMAGQFMTYTPTAAALDPCDETQTHMDLNSINYRKKYCPGEGDSGDRYHLSWFIDRPEGRESKAPKVKFQDFDTCIPGQESVQKCTSNPDIESCDDETFPIIRQITDLEGRLIRQFSYCPGDPEASDQQGEQQETLPVVTPDQFRSFPIQGSTVSSEPNKFSLRNGHTHLWASKNLQTFNAAIDDSNVRIKAIPIQWNWSYGDGTSRKFGFPGEPSPGHTLHHKTATSHLYTETGTFSVGVTTLYRGEFSVDGGPWQGIPGQAAVPSTPIQMDVWRTKKELIAND